MELEAKENKASSELEEAIKNVMVLLGKEFHPHVSLNLTATTAEIVEGVQCFHNEILPE